MRCSLLFLLALVVTQIAGAQTSPPLKFSGYLGSGLVYLVDLTDLGKNDTLFSKNMTWDRPVYLELNATYAQPAYGLKFTLLTSDITAYKSSTDMVTGFGWSTWLDGSLGLVLGRIESADFADEDQNRLGSWASRWNGGAVSLAAIYTPWWADGLVLGYYAPLPSQAEGYADRTNGENSINTLLGGTLGVNYSLFKVFSLRATFKPDASQAKSDAQRRPRLTLGLSQKMVDDLTVRFESSYTFFGSTLPIYSNYNQGSPMTDSSDVQFFEEQAGYRVNLGGGATFEPFFTVNQYFHVSAPDKTEWQFNPVLNYNTGPANYALGFAYHTNPADTPTVGAWWNISPAIMIPFGNDSWVKIGGDVGFAAGFNNGHKNLGMNVYVDQQFKF
jgi:hypothetical protein